ncbi:MAG: DUF2304 domain-containing protein [Lachnospiraceae bacterium]|nr:DUF2304 domain-containing protein [Lachnospiraceae bacterium]
MMEVKLQIIIALVVVIGILYIVSLIRRNRLELKYALSWLIIAVLVLVLDGFPGLMENLAELLGIASPVNMMFFLGFLFSLVIVLTLTVAVSIAAGSVKRLNQKIALMEKRIENLERNRKEDGENEV